MKTKVIHGYVFKEGEDNDYFCEEFGFYVYHFKFSNGEEAWISTMDYSSIKVGRDGMEESFEAFLKELERQREKLNKLLAVWDEREV
jgi:hypothetical protein